VQWGFLTYRDDEPTSRLLAWNVNLNVYGFTDLSPQIMASGGNVNGNVTLANHWSVGGGLNVDVNRWDPRALRGGPELRDDAAGSLWGFVSSDPRKRVSANLNFNANRKPVNDGWGYTVSGGVTVQARSNLDLFAGPMLTISEDDSQYIDEVDDGAGAPHYLFGRIHQVITGLTVRANWTFTPRLSLQAYAMPFIAAGAYSHYKEAADTHARSYDARFSQFGAGALNQVDDVINVDRNGDGVADFHFDRPDFDVRQLRSNLVLRWEYRPGSAAFLIWSHQRDDEIVDGRFRLGSDLRALGGAQAEHVVMIKVNYWIGL
jgi:hypothetical protein